MVFDVVSFIACVIFGINMKLTSMHQKNSQLDYYQGHEILMFEQNITYGVCDSDGLQVNLTISNKNQTIKCMLPSLHDDCENLTVMVSSNSTFIMRNGEVWKEFTNFTFEKIAMNSLAKNTIWKTPKFCSAGRQCRIECLQNCKNKNNINNANLEQCPPNVLVTLSVIFVFVIIFIFVVFQFYSRIDYTYRNLETNV